MTDLLVLVIVVPVVAFVFGSFLFACAESAWRAYLFFRRSK